MQRIPLTSGRIALESGVVAMVSDEDFALVSGRKWRVFFANGTRIYAVSGKGLLMHRLIMSAPRGLDVDHINGDGLDNRRENLRIGTRSQNLANQLSRRVWSGRQTTSKFKGVCLMPGNRVKPWRATISVDGRQHSLGYYGTEEAAAVAYDAAAKRFFGDFARTNF